MMPTLAVLFMLTYTAAMWLSLGPAWSPPVDEAGTWVRPPMRRWHKIASVVCWALSLLLLLTLLIINHFR